MDTEQSGLLDPSVNFSLASNSLIKLDFDPLPSPFNYSDLYLDIENDQLFMEFAASLDSSNQKAHEPCLDNRDTEVENESDPVATGFDWNPRTVLTDLASVEQKIHKVQDIVHSIIGKQGKMPTQQGELAAQQQLVTADVTSIIKQLISTAGSLLPSAHNALVSADSSAGQLENGKQCSTDVCDNNNLVRNGIAFINKMEFSDHDMVSMSNIAEEDYEIMLTDDHDVRDCEDVGEECESLLVGSYEVLQLEKEEILAPYTHLCQICGKGFKRDANLRMHMRGHGDQYKTPAALAKPTNDSSSGAMLIKRYSCPSVGCKRNKEHKDFQPLKTLLCMKNHYKRTHCDKRYTCSRCNKKKFSVLADLKTHEKHCGRNKWLCSCGTTFSRKDKLFGHVALFQGHAPALHVGNTNNNGPKAPSLVWKTEAVDDNVSVGLNSHKYPLSVDFTDIKDFDSGLSFNQSATFCAPSFGGFHEFPRP